MRHIGIQKESYQFHRISAYEMVILARLEIQLRKNTRPIRDTLLYLRGGFIDRKLPFVLSLNLTPGYISRYIYDKSIFVQVITKHPPKHFSIDLL